jgi:hypothetical protein
MDTGGTSNQAGGASEMTQGEAMAEEKKPEPRAKRSARKLRAATKKKAEAPEPKELKVLPSEQPVPSAPQKKTTQYVVTVDNQTGAPVKIEKLDDATGKRKELTAEEYGQAMLYASLSQTPYYGSTAGQAPASATGANALTQAYYQGVADYINALTSNK